MPKRAALSQYFGSKLEMLDWLYSLTPPHTTSVEVFGGMGSWTIYKDPAPVAVFNDENDDIANVFRMVRGRSAELSRLLADTPYSRAEWAACKRACVGPVPAKGALERARQYLTLLRQSRGGQAQAWSLVIGHSRRGMASSCSRWLNLPGDVQTIAARLRMVQVERLDFETCVEKYDSPGTLFYADPPYIQTGHSYKHGFPLEGHKRLLRCLHRCRGKVILSGYAHPLYDLNLTPARGWRREEARVHCRSAKDARGNSKGDAARTEVVWIKGG